MMRMFIITVLDNLHWSLAVTKERLASGSNFSSCVFPVVRRRLKTTLSLFCLCVGNKASLTPTAYHRIPAHIIGDFPVQSTPRLAQLQFAARTSRGKNVSIRFWVVFDKKGKVGPTFKLLGQKARSKRTVYYVQTTLGLLLSGFDFAAKHFLANVFAFSKRKTATLGSIQHCCVFNSVLSLQY